jgi:hypothetical protein
VTQTAYSTSTVTPIVSNNATITPPIVTVETTETATTTTTEITFTSTSTVEATETATQTVSIVCNDPFICTVGNVGGSGCSNGNCFCFQVNNSPSQGICSTATSSSGMCEVNADCGDGNICLTNTCIGNACVPYEQACENTNGPAATRRRFRRGPGHRSVWNVLSGQYVDVYN